MDLITEKIKDLPPSARKVVEDVIDLMLQNKRSPMRKKPKLDWVGALKGVDEPLTSVELQHEISKWRTEED